MKKILSFFVLFDLNFFTVYATVNHIAMESIQKEFAACNSICSAVITKDQKEEYLQRSVWLLNQAINLLDKDKALENLDKAAWDLVRARIKGADPKDIDRYFSQKLPSLPSIIDGKSYISFAEYLTKRNTKCRVADIRDAMIKCYLPTLLHEEPVTETDVSATTANQPEENYTSESSSGSSLIAKANKRQAAEAPAQHQQRKRTRKVTQATLSNNRG